MKAFLILCLMGLLAWGGWYYYQQSSSVDEAEVAEMLSEKPVITPPAAPTPPKPKPAPAPVVTEPEPEVVEAPPEPEPTPEPVIVKKEEPVVEEKSDLDMLLEQTYPLPDFKPLVELVDNWTNVPTRAFPPEITVNLPVEYELKSGSTVIGKSQLPGGHTAKPLKFKPGSLTAHIDLGFRVGSI